MSNDPASFNPYLATSHVGNTTGTGSDGATFQACRSLALWQTVIAVLLLIGAGFVGLAMVFQVIGMAMSSNGAVPGLVMFGFLVIMAVLFYILPAVLLLKSSSVARRIGATQVASFDELIVAQTKFWKYTGIMIIVFIALYMLIIVGAVVFGVALGTMR